MIRFILLFISSLTSFIISGLYAQTFAGGEIYYELISAKKYRITAHVYRMCDKAPLNQLYGSVYGGTYVEPMSFTRTAISRINDTCGNPCNNQNATSNAGFEKHTFVDTVDFNVAPFDVFVTNNICVVNFGVRQGGRSSGLTTLPSGIFYLDASTDICLSNITKNTSPKFSMEPKFLAGCNLPMSYSPGPLDTMDNDSFSFSLVDVQSDYQTNVAYNGSFTSQIPMSPFCLPPGVINCKPLPSAKPPRGFYFDKGRCQTGFTPNSCSEKGVIKYRVDEYRYNVQTKKYEWLGYVTREMFMQIVPVSNNNSPQILGSTSYGLCAGNKICFTIRTTDSKAPGQLKDDTTALFWDNGIKDATFRIIDSSAREKQGEFCWQTKNVNKRLETNFFTTASFDKMCNISLVTNTYRVMVRPMLPYTYSNTIGKCGLVKWTASANDSFYSNLNFSCKTVIRLFQTNQVLYIGYGLTDSTNIHENGKILIEHIFNYTVCPVVVVDSVTINGAISNPDINDNSNAIVCKNVMVPFHFKASRIEGLKAFKWFLNDSLVNETDTIISLALMENSVIKLQVENNAGCTSERSLTYVLKTHNAIINTNATFCPGTVVTVNANLKSLAKPVTYFWKMNNVDTAVNDSNLVFKIEKETKVVLIIEDANQCVFTDSVTYFVWPLVKFILSYNNTVCRDSTTIVKAKNIVAARPYVYLWQVDGKAVTNNDSILVLKPAKNTDVSLMITDKNTCSLKESAVISVLKTPEVTLPDSIQACYNTTVNIVPTVTNRPSTINYLWTYNKAIIGTDSFLKRKVTVSQLIKLKVSNQLNCAMEASINIAMYPKSTLAIHDNGTVFYHPSSLIITGTTSTFATYKWFNGATTQQDTFWANTLGPPGKYKIWCDAIDNYGCSYSDTMQIFTDQFLSGKHEEIQSLQIYPNPVSGMMKIVCDEDLVVVLYSMDGKALKEVVLQKGVSTIDMSGYASGIYLLKPIGSGNRTYKIIKE